MNLFDRVIRRTEAWLDRLDRERDLAMSCMKREGSKPHLLVWMDQLEGERLKHLDLIAKLQALQRANHPALLFSTRPVRSAKASLRRRRQKAVAS